MKKIPADCLGAYVTATRKRYSYVFVCAGCDKLACSSRADAITCSPACRVRLHRHPAAIEPLKAMQAMASAGGYDVSPAMLLQAAALERLLPDMAARMRAGEVEMKDIRGNVWQAFWAAVSRENLEPTRPAPTNEGHDHD